MIDTLPMQKGSVNLSRRGVAHSQKRKFLKKGEVNLIRAIGTLPTQKGSVNLSRRGVAHSQKRKFLKKGRSEI